MIWSTLLQTETMGRTRSGEVNLHTCLYIFICCRQSGHWKMRWGFVHMLCSSPFTAENGAIAEEEGFAHMLVHLTLMKVVHISSWKQIICCCSFESDNVLGCRLEHLKLHELWLLVELVFGMMLQWFCSESLCLAWCFNGFAWRVCVWHDASMVLLEEFVLAWCFNGCLESFCLAWCSNCCL